jgi:hypothetical protein
LRFAIVAHLAAGFAALRWHGTPLTLFGRCNLLVKMLPFVPSQDFHRHLFADFGGGDTD